MESLSVVTENFVDILTSMVFGISATKVGCPVCFTKLHIDLEVQLQ